jgi:hypothetical protein
LILARPYRLRAETRSAYYLVRVLADSDADRELVRGPENAFTLAAQHLAQAQELIAYQGVSERRAKWAGCVHQSGVRAGPDVLGRRVVAG